MKFFPYSINSFQFFHNFSEISEIYSKFLTNSCNINLKLPLLWWYFFYNFCRINYTKFSPPFFQFFFFFLRLLRNFIKMHQKLLQKHSKICWKFSIDACNISQKVFRNLSKNSEKIIDFFQNCFQIS